MYTPIPKFPSYGITRRGDVMRLDSQRPLVPVKTSQGYHCFTLSEKGEKTWVHRHTLVAWTFLGSPPFPKAEIAHFDGNPGNDHVDNLRWASHKENGNDMVRHGRVRDISGEKHFNAKLTNEDVFSIRRSAETQRVLSVRFGVNQSTISRIKSNKRWCGISSSDYPPERQRLSHPQF